MDRICEACHGKDSEADFAGMTRERLERICAQAASSRDEAERKCAALAADLARQKALLGRVASQLESARAKYDMLANAKLGRLTLAYWRLKDACKSRLKAIRFPCLGRKRKHGRSLDTVGHGGDFAYEVSVVIPTHRPIPDIHQAIGSVLRQNLQGAIQVLVCVNGGDEEYCRSLRKQYKDHPNVEVLFATAKGINVGRGIGAAAARGRFLVFLDDDDYLTPGYLKTLVAGFSRPQVNIVAGRLVDEDPASRVRNEDTYINRALAQFGTVSTNDYLRMASFFSSLAMKAYRTESFKKLGELPTQYRHTEDVLFWAERFDRLEGEIALCEARSSEAYVRRTTPGSLSRPMVAGSYSFFVTDRLEILDLLKEMVLHVARSELHKRFILGKIKAQTAMMLRYVNSAAKDLARSARDEIRAYENIFLNKSLFAERAAIAFCHNFAPYIDASSFAATKRLNEIGELEGGLLAWNVISQDMSRIREKDLVFQRYYADFAYSRGIELHKVTGFAPKLQLPYVSEALAEAEKLPQAEVIYSRSLFPGSHIAAYEYKKRHPKVKWYAEFSDPLARGVDGKERACLEKPDWNDVEQMVYELADAILFTNANQLEYMLSYNANPRLEDSIRARAIVRRHPVVSPEYRLLSPCPYELDESKINIGYFGTFYMTRKADDMLNLMLNGDVVLHIFTTKPEELQPLVARYGGQIRVNPVVGHFEAMNLGARMDYLFIADTEFHGKVNPYLPSKYADYLVAGTRIIAKIAKGSVLSTEENPLLIKVESIDAAFAGGLGKKSR